MISKTVLHLEYTHYKANINSIDTVLESIHLSSFSCFGEVGFDVKPVDQEWNWDKIVYPDWVCVKATTVANNAFGKLIRTKPAGEKSRQNLTFQEKDGCWWPSSEGLSLAKQISLCYQRRTEWLHPEQHTVQWRKRQIVLPQYTCLFGDGSYGLEECVRFRNKAYKERKEFVLKKKL